MAVARKFTAVKIILWGANKTGPSNMFNIQLVFSLNDHCAMANNREEKKCGLFRPLSDSFDLRSCS